MEQSPSEANRFAASQEIPLIFWNPNVHYRINTCQAPVPILSQLDPVHTSTSHFLKMHINIILSSTPESPKWSLSLRFPHQNPVHASPLPHSHYMPRPSHSSRFYHPDIIRWGVQIISLLAPELFFFILAHPVYKMWIIQEPNTLELWNKLHFEEKKRRVYTMFKIFSTYICWINI